MSVDMTSFARAGDAYEWGPIGDTIKGEIIQIKPPEERENYGKTGMETVMVITIRQADGEAAAIYPRLVPYSSMGGAIADAVAQHGGKLEEGGKLAVQYQSDLDTGKGQPARIFVAQYAPPVKSVLLESVAEPVQAPVVTEPAQPAPADDLLDF